jgi:hypothetical protein
MGRCSRPRSVHRHTPEVIPLKGWPAIGDGILGREWFATWRPAADTRSIEVAFNSDADGHRVSDFARLTVRVDGEDLPILFDTGATTILTPAALQELADGKAAMRATSMMSHKAIERWRARQPDWRVIEDAQLGTHSLMILAPEVEFAGRKTGAVWFTERSDNTYDEFMSPMMSDRIEGSIGGNVLGGFVIGLDYRRSKAWVQ